MTDLFCPCKQMFQRGNTQVVAIPGSVQKACDCGLGDMI